MIASGYFALQARAFGIFAGLGRAALSSAAIMLHKMESGFSPSRLRSAC
jgi:hypothetical protein